MIRNFRRPPLSLRRPVVALSIAAAFGLAAAGAAQAQVSVDVGVSAAEPGWLYDLGAVISVFIDPPVYEPEPVAVAWAPPPMLVEEVPPQPDPYAVWTGGYWTWQGDWVWCAGRWMDPPQPQYVWVQPYYEHRAERVIFIPGYWSQPDVEFVAPPMDRPIAWGYVNEGVVIGPPPEGPVGIFVPPPPGSRPGLIVPAPIGTPPAVVVSAPPVLAVGMRVSAPVTIDARHTINDNRVTNYSVTNIRNITNVTVIAPAGATASGRAFQAEVPHRAALAAAQRPQVAARAPVPVSRTAMPAYVPGRTVAALPAPQKVQGLPAVPTHVAADVTQAQRAQMAHAPMTPTEARQARANGRDVDTAHMPAAGPQGARPSPQADQRAQPEQAQQRAVQEQAQRAEQMRAQQAQSQQQKSQQEQAQAQQRAQQQAEQQRAQQERSQQAEQQRAQQEAQQRAQQQAQQRAQQEQAQRAEQQRAQQEAQQRAQQQADQRAQQQAQQRADQQRAQQEQAQRAEQQRAQQEAQQRAQQEQAQRAQAQQRGEQPRQPQEQRGERPRPRDEGASRPSNGHD